MSLEDFLNSYGYAAVLAGTFLEGETILILAGIAAKMGYLDLRWVILMGGMGSFAGDQFYFYLGRRHSRYVLNRWGRRWRSGIEKAQSILKRRQIAAMVGFRFFYGFRVMTPFIIGMSDIPYARFAFFNSLAALSWSVIVGSLGFMFGQGVEILLGDIKQFELKLMAAVAFAGFVVWMVHLKRSRKLPGKR